MQPRSSSGRQSVAGCSGRTLVEGQPACGPWRWVVVWLAGATVASALTAAVCTVPGQYPTLQAAIEDDACTTIGMTAGSFPGALLLARPAMIEGAGIDATILGGQLLVQGSGTSVSLSDVTIANTCPQAVVVRDSAQLVPHEVEIVAAPPGECRLSGSIFEDGFESGDTSAWGAART